LSCSIQGVGAGAKLLTNDVAAADRIQSSFESAADQVNTAFKSTGEKLGYLANRTVQLAGIATGEGAAAVAKAVGAAPENVERAKKVGTVAGAATVGFVAGATVADLAVVLAAAPGATGAATMTSGLAGLGGGSLAAGGGGMAVGHVVTEAVAAVGAMSGVAVNADVLIDAPPRGNNASQLLIENTCSANEAQ
jgi:hypothetical protein